MKSACLIAATTRCFRQPLKRAIRTAAEIGATGVHLTGGDELRPNEFSQSGRKQFLHMLGEFGLKVAGVSLPMQTSRRG